MCDDVVFMAKGARHPLQELTVESYIPNDIVLGPGGRYIAVVTGQNGSGKSVFLKMVGVMQFLAQVGSFVPATEATIGVVNKIFSRILSLETATLCQSAFSIDCNQLATMMNHGDAKSLLLIDEFGKGTCPSDGICLLTSALKHLKDQVVQFGGPRVVLTTHFLEIFREPTLSGVLGFQPADTAATEWPSKDDDSSSVITTYVMSSVAVEGKESDAVHRTSSLYELVPGISTSSNAIQCAIAAGMDNDTVKRAAQVLQLSRNRCHIEVPVTCPSPKTHAKLDAFYTLTELFMAEETWKTCPLDKVTELLRMARSIDGIIQ
ncbi:hypothetical protein AaE_014996 [Aphanomyces astaci]|uniref:DNA mismatch repair proteins mutS family domain-containing protein n=2 Tax=Aphanomyces astaci TaxID=112090 RepID=A0A6A4Z2L5_APHAT|nr:hypothetical protein AaE_014996 [Aphanomyces astaci]